MRRKSSILFVVTFLVVLIGSTGVFAQQKVKIDINGSRISFDVDPVIEGGRTLVPVRGVVEQIGGEVKWDEKQNAVWIEHQYMDIQLVIGNSTAYIYRKYDFSSLPQEVKLDAPAKIIKGRSLVPIRFIAEILGAEVKWDPVTFTVQINTKSDINPVEKPLDFSKIAIEDIKEEKELMSWYGQHYKAKGVYQKTVGNKLYVLISAGERATGGYSIEVNSATLINTETVYVSVEVKQPAKGSIVTQAITYPYVLLVFNEGQFNSKLSSIKVQSDL